jgi:hypothetical protein
VRLLPCPQCPAAAASSSPTSAPADQLAVADIYQSPGDRADEEVASLLERVHSLVPLMSPEAVTRTARKLRLVQRDVAEAHSASRRSPCSSEEDEDEDGEEEADPTAALDFAATDSASDAAGASDDGRQDGSSGDELAADGELLSLRCHECSDDEPTSEEGSQPPSPGGARQLEREAYKRRRRAADARQRSAFPSLQRSAFPSLVSSQLKCQHCMAGGALGLGACESAAMVEFDDINDIIAAEVPFVDSLDGEAREDACRSARYKMYRGVIAWKFADPLGSGRRRRIPDCCVWQIRDLFPDPRCDETCDYLRGCERKGHYVGFRTAAESKAAREGMTLIDLEYED